jgi:Transposase DNA-binding/Transposase Tn5 dimerisation domain
MNRQTWASIELATASFGDRRLNRRLARIVDDLTAAPGVSLPHACGSWAATKACYNFLASTRVTAEKIRMPHYQSTLQRIGHHRVVLAVQDTSSLDFTAKRGTRGLGYLQGPFQRGIMIHTCLALTPSGEVLGLLSQQSWVRPLQEYGRRHQRKQRPTADKETQRWLDVQRAATAAIPVQSTVITIADREADSYAFLAAERPANAEVLIRVAHNRRISGPLAHLHEAIAALPEAGRMSVEIGRANERAPRQARLRVSFGTVEILAPKHQVRSEAKRRGLDDDGGSLPHDSLPQSITVSVVAVREIDPPPQERPVEWLLLTSLRIASLEAAIECVGFYSQRWLIERFHYTLKSGCAIEELQLESVERLDNALAVLSIVAWRLLWLLYHARAEPEASCEEFLEQHEWQLLYMKEHRGKPLPSRPPTLQQAVRWIAKLGGFLARRLDGDPGIKTLWRGLRRLNDLAEAWQLSRQSSSLMGNA